MAVYLRVRLRRLAKRQASLTRAAEFILAAVRESQSELSLELVGDRRMRRLNRMYRGKDRPTDVLAFPMRESHNPCPMLLGDVVISVPTARRQAKESGRSVGDELAALLVHGVLHLCGYDHERSAREAMRMRRRETTIVKKLNSVPHLVIPRTSRRARKR